MTSVGPDVLQRKGSPLPMAPLVDFMSDPSFPNTHLHSKSPQRNRHRQKLVHTHTMCPSAGASESVGRSHSSGVQERAGAGGWTFCYLPGESWADRKAFGLSITPDGHHPWGHHIMNSKGDLLSQLCAFM